MHIHEAAKLYCQAGALPSGDGWRTVETSEFNALLAGGWSPVEYVSVVTMRQFRRALIVSGINPAIVAQTITAAIPDALQCALAQSDWEFATEVHRDNPLVVAVGAELGKSSAEVDAIFTLADTFAA